MTWNYQVVKLAENWFEVREVFYDEEKNPIGFASAEVGGETLDELLTNLRMMERDIKQLPVFSPPADWLEGDEKCKQCGQ